MPKSAEGCLHPVTDEFDSRLIADHGHLSDHSNGDRRFRFPHEIIECTRCDIPEILVARPGLTPGVDELKLLGVHGEFGQSAYNAIELYRKHGIDSESMVKAAQNFFN